MIKSKIIVSGLLFAVMSVATAQAQEVTARIPELETNETYMTLMRNDARLRFKTDSLLGVVRQLRGELNRNAESRDSLAQQRSDSISVLLTDAEAAIFATRAQKIKLIDQINTIEQEQVLSSLGNIGEAQGASSSGSIYANSYFRNSIEAEDFKALMVSHGKEADAQSHAQAYVKNYNRIKELYDKYVLAQTEAEAENIYTELSTMRDENMVLERQLTKLWTEIYDQKSYVYSYFLEKEGREDVLELAENMMSEARQEKLISIDNCVSEPLADYRLQKPVILNYEVYVAKLLNLTSAIDSLSNASRVVRQIDYRLPKVDIERRSFVDYQAIEFSSRSPYTTSNPIPDCIVYEYGTIYRILLGTFKYKQAVSIFRNASPLSVETLEDGRFSYYAGGFHSRAEAEKAVEVMKKKGFKNPQIVEWCDGYKTNISEAGESVSFRLVISGAALDDTAREIIAEMAPDCQLSRVSEYNFIVGMFASRAMADRVAQAVGKCDPDLVINIEEIRPEADEEE